MNCTLIEECEELSEEHDGEEKLRKALANENWISIRNKILAKGKKDDEDREFQQKVSNGEIKEDL